MQVTELLPLVELTTATMFRSTDALSSSTGPKLCFQEVHCRKFPENVQHFTYLKKTSNLSHENIKMIAHAIIFNTDINFPGMY